MTSSECLDTNFDVLIGVSSDEFQYLESTDNWLTSDLNLTFTQDVTEDKDITVWIRNAFCSERSKGTHMSLINKLDELKVISPSVDTRTFTRHKRNVQKRQSLFNGSGMSSLCSPVTEDDYSSPEANDRTFEVQTNTNKKSLNGTFSKASADTTFTLINEDIPLNNIDDVEKIARQQEDSLRESCSNGWSPSRQRSPTRSQLVNCKRAHILSDNHNINTNTLTKSRDPLKFSRLTEALMDETMDNKPEDDDQLYYENGLSPEDSFRSHLAHNTSTPLVPKSYRTIPNYTQTQAQEGFREPMAPKIMPDISNLRAIGRDGKSKIGRSEPNLSGRLQPMGKGLAFNPSKANSFGNRPTEPNRTFLESKTPSDSRLVVKNGLRLPTNHNPMQTLGRLTSPPPPSQALQLLNRKVAVEGELNRMGATITTTTTTNLCRKSTFRVRDYAINSEDNLRDNGIDLCFTNSNTNASTNGSQTNKTINNNKVQRNVSKIPGPKSVRSGIPVCGQRTGVQCPTNYKLANHTDNSWKNGCF